MLELKELRAYNKKVYALGGNKKRAVIYAGLAHYYNKLGVGDGKIGYRELDYSLQWDKTRRGWFFEFNNFHPFLPEYADDWCLFRDVYKDKDTEIRLRPVCNHVKGRLITEEDGLDNLASNVNSVIYDDAFGVGIDLIYVFRNRKLVKLVRVRDGFKPTVDTAFRFEIELPENKEVYRALDTESLNKGEGYEFTQDSDKEFDTPKSFFIKGGVDTYTRIAPFRVWDSGGHGKSQGRLVELTPSRFLIREGKKYLEKTVTADFFSRSLGDVYTDATQDVSEDKDTYYGTVYSTGGEPNATEMSYGGWGDHYYPFIEWDLSGAPAADDTTQAEVDFYVETTPVNNPNLNYHRVTESWTEAGVTSSNNPSFDSNSFATPDGTMTVGHDTTDITTQYKNWKNGTYTNYGISVRDTYNNQSNGGHYASSDHATTSYHPKIVVTYTDEPDVTTNDASNVDVGSATLNGNLDDLGSESSVDVYFEYGSTPSFGSSTTKQSKSSTGAFLDNISFLAELDVYYFRAVVEKSDQTKFYGATKRFYTADVDRVEYNDNNDFAGGTLNNVTTDEEQDLILGNQYTQDDDESFEASLGDWSNAAGDDFDWTRDSGGTPSTNTGPNHAQDGSYYLYTESSSPNYPNKTAIVEYTLSSAGAGRITFYYHMFGANMGTLYLEAYNGSSWDTIWSISGQQHTSYGAAYTQVQVEFPAGTQKLRFRGVTGSNWLSDMAIDKVTVELGGYHASGNRIAPSLDVGAITNVNSSKIEWQETRPANTDVVVKTAVNTSSSTPPSAGSFVACTNGGSIQGINPSDDLTGKYLWVKVELSTTDTAVTPQLHEIAVGIKQSTGGTNHVKNISETLTLAEVVTRKSQKALIDGIMISDIYINKTGKFLTSTITLVDSIDIIGGFVQIITEIVTATENLIRATKKSVSEIINTADSMIRTFGKTLILEAMAIADALTKKSTKLILSSIVLIDAISTAKITQKVVSDMVDFTDMLAKKITRRLSSVVSLVDSVAATKVVQKIINDSVNFTDALVHNTKKVITDILNISDVLTQINNFIRTLAVEAVTISDNTATVIRKVIINAVNIIESFSVSVLFLKVLNELVAITDNLRRTITRLLSETLSAIDVFFQSIAYQRILIDSLSVIDHLNRAIKRTIFEIIAIFDPLNRAVRKGLAEVAHVTDNIDFVAALMRVLVEVVIVTDSIKKRLSKGLDEVIHLIGTIGFGSKKLFTETVNLADSIVRGLKTILADSLSLIDSIYIKLPFKKILVELLTVGDNISKNIKKVLFGTLILIENALTKGFFHKVLTETIAVADNFKKTAGKILIEVLNISDAFARTVNYIKILIENLKVNEIFKKILTLPRTIKVGVEFLKAKINVLFSTAKKDIELKNAGNEVDLKGSKKDIDL